MTNAATSKLECDLIMRGGITSGLVYPRAIAKLAQSYRFRSIGGTSVGALAAAASAAAALGAKNGEDHFQTRLKNLPDELAKHKDGKSVLERLFQPEPGTRRLFRVFMAGLGRRSWASNLARVAGALCLNYWLFAILGAFFILAPLVLLASTSTLERQWLWIPLSLGVIAAVVGAVVAAAAQGAWDIFHRLPENGYGLCRGSSNGKPDKAGVLPLTDWLHQLLQEVAGKKYGDDPVTFGELWNKDWDERGERDIELVLMTTNITRGISQRLPFMEGSWGQLFFRKADFDALFPESVVSWIWNNPAEIRSKDIEVPSDYRPLPDPAKLPILLGARLSLSFPFLISAVPLYAGNPFKRSPDGKIPLDRCWFSDGGLTSNFPLHFFDAPLPSRPTFGINLVPATVSMSEDGEPSRLVYMPSKNSSGIGFAARFNNFEGEKGDVAGFFGALFDTARNWSDSELMAMPGYRDRIVHVALQSDEGGLNLNMPEELIQKVAERGEQAGEMLAARFRLNPSRDIELTWDNHRWVRYRSLMAGLELVIRRLSWAWKESDTQARSYQKLLDRAKNELPKSYPFGTVGQARFAKDMTQRILNLFASPAEEDQTFDRIKSQRGRSPRPKPVLRLMPPGTNDPRAER
jgi:predicted acylesterase/phospholipase RssA